MLFSNDETVVDAVLAAATSLAVPCAVVDDVTDLAARWGPAPVVLIGGDAAALVASRALPARRGVFVVGFDGPELTRWSVPLGAPVVELPHGLAQIAEVLAHDDAGAAPVVAVVGGSGGIGSSTLAAGLALAAARRGLGAALVDLDPWGGGVDLLLGAERTPGWRWPRLAGARGEVSDVRAFLPDVDGVSVVSMARDEAVEPSAEAVNAVVGSLARHHALVLLDVGRPGGGTSGPARAASRVAAQTLLVTGADVRSASATRALLASGGWPTARLVVRERPGVRVPVSLVAEAVGVPCVGVLPTDAALLRAAEAGDPPGSRRGSWGRAVAALVDVALGAEAIRGAGDGR